MSPTFENPQTPAPATPRRGFVRRWARRIALTMSVLVALGTTGWAGLAVYFADTHTGPRPFAAAVVVLLMTAAAVLVRPRLFGAVAFMALFGTVLAWFFSLSPSNDRDWAPDVARVPTTTLDGDHLTIRNVRNFDYRSETDFTPAWEDRTYDLSKVRRVDLLLVHWGSKALAHAMVSFEFADGQVLCVSIETRKERHEAYSAVEGFFRQYELIYIFGDERDLVRLRTTFRKEQVYLYRTTLSPAQARAALLSNARAADALAARPEFYNALTSNCATNVLNHARSAWLPGELSWEILLSGYAARKAHRNGHLDASMPFEQLEARSLVNDAAVDADNDPRFSSLIRAGLPTPPTSSVAGPGH
ncbi:MAG: DUF4105 domain-containing protein [Phycisphaerae bacterium]|nr:DUF4105 domain-containing protein [Tepidisphaeraceae bacterium]